MSERQFQIGVIGGGMIGREHLKNFAGDRRTRVRWVADVASEALEHAGKHFGVEHLTRDYRKVLGDPAVDAVVVATLPSLHYRMAVDVMQAGKHLLLEKPMARTVPEARKLLAESRKHPRLLISDCSCRHARLNPKFAFVRDFIASGKLGKVYFVHHNSIARQGRGGIEYHPTAKWFLNRRIAGGGPMLDWGVYDLSFHLGVLGEVKVTGVEAGFCINGLDRVEPGTKQFTVEEHGAAWLKLAGGVKYYWERSTNVHNDAPNETRIYGTTGGLRLGYCTWDDPVVEHFYVDRDGRGTARTKKYRIEMGEHRSDMHQLGRAFVDALESGGPAPMPLDLALKHMDVIDKVYKVARWQGGGRFRERTVRSSRRPKR